MKSKQFILLGPPGIRIEAKAKALASRLQVPLVSGYALLGEAEAGAGRPDLALGIKRVRQRMEQPDVMLKGFVLAGFPRSLAEAQAFDDLLSGFGQSAPQVVHLKAMKGLLIQRLLAEQKQVARDAEGAGQVEPVSTIRNRLARHEEAIAPLLCYYDGRLTTLNAFLSVDEILVELAQAFYEEDCAADWIRDEAELDSLLRDDSLLVVDCMASWCGPCKLVAPMIDQLADSYGDRARVRKIDFDVNKQLPKRFELKGMPAVMFFKGGELQETLTGVKPYQAYSAVVSRFLE